jgi:hypothetical protein
VRATTGPPGGALPRRADLVVVGGGVLGASIAWHARREGAAVLLVERATLGSGATSRAAALLTRAHGLPCAERVPRRREFADSPRPSGRPTLDSEGQRSACGRSSSLESLIDTLERLIATRTGTALVLIAALALGLALDRVLTPLPAAHAAAPGAGSKELARLDLAKLFVTTEDGTRIAPAVHALNGRRVRVVGYMARMEGAPRGSFYLTRDAVEADESGAGTADLPPHAVRVEVPRLSGEEIAWVPDLVDAIGTLEVGRAEDSDGRVSWLRVVLDAPGSASRESAGPTNVPAPASGVVTRSEYQEEEHP